MIKDKQLYKVSNKFLGYNLDCLLYKSGEDIYTLYPHIEGTSLMLKAYRNSDRVDSDFLQLSPVECGFIKELENAIDGNTPVRKNEFFIVIIPQILEYITKQIS